MNAPPEPAPRRTPEWLVLLLIAVLALALRAVFLAGWAQTALFHAPQGDELNFHRTALLLREGKGPGEFFYQPLYGFFLFLIYSLFGPSVSAVRTLQLFLGTGTVLIFYGLGRELGRRRDENWGRWAGRICALLVALYGPQVFFEGMLLAPVLVVPAVAGALWALLACLRRHRWYLALAAGVLLGAAMMDRPNLACVLPVFLLGLVGRKAAPMGRLAAAGVFLVGLAVGVLPSWLYNASQGLWWVPVSASGGHSFFIGNNPEATGTFHVPRSLPIDDTSHEAYRQSLAALAERAEGRRLSLGEVSSYWLRQGLRFWLERPGQALRLAGKKLLYALGAEERPIHHPYLFVCELVPPLAWLLGFGVLFPFAALALWPAGRLRGRWLLFAAAGLYLLSLVAFYVADRYRIVLLPLLAPLAALGMLELRSAVRLGAGAALGRVVLLLLTFVLTQWSRPGEIQRLRAMASGYNWLGKAAGDLGDLAGAEKAFLRSAELAGPGRGAPARTNLGILAERRGRPDEARAHYLEAARANPRWKEARRRLARLSEAEGNLEEALRWWRELAALEAEPERVRAHIDELERSLAKRSLSPPQAQ